MNANQMDNKNKCYALARELGDAARKARGDMDAVEYSAFLDRLTDILNATVTGGFPDGCSGCGRKGFRAEYDPEYGTACSDENAACALAGDGGAPCGCCRNAEGV